MVYAATDSLLFSARDVYLDDARRLWDLNGAAPFIHVFDSTSALLRISARVATVAQTAGALQLRARFRRLQRCVGCR